MENINYQEEFSVFLKDYHSREVDAEEMGAFIMRLTQVFIDFNMKAAGAQRELALVARDIENRTDSTGKTITSAKAKTFIDATDEADRYNILKTHLENIERCIAAVKTLQKGALKEYSYVGNT